MCKIKKCSQAKKVAEVPHKARLGGTCLQQSEWFPSRHQQHLPWFGRQVDQTEKPSNFEIRLRLEFPAEGAAPAGVGGDFHIGFETLLYSVVYKMYLPTVLPVVLSAKLFRKSFRVKELCDISLTRESCSTLCAVHFLNMSFSFSPLYKT